ncbi:B12-binding domain-containing radical SAM protein [Neofamilia massiliensis]|uniref:B12-binding domain-containing radical SAM protein n=1 Tax=Neofamilia massiliensis TaxID=1673724 RepID=UPI0006BB9823|nr:B12-binding domain-containing radical SAM protein [Neofamilia massiliensis]
MKILLVGINAKYSHQNLAIEYIKRYLKSENVKTLDFNINQNIDDIYREIIKENPDVLGFSSYIWNINFVERLTSDLKKAKEDLFIVWGGPEVSFDSQEIMEKNPAVDLIIRGEGEETALRLLQALENKKPLDDILGITYRKDGNIIKNLDRPLIQDLDTIPSPFIDYQAPKGKMVYFEMTRGCPFKCAYCLSSTTRGLRRFSTERIKADILRLIDSGADTIKLVDRTFNANEKFSMEIMDFILANARPGMCFHMELMAHLISDDFLKFLEKMPVGLFQFEIGIQSANEKTLAVIDRVTDLERLAKVVRTIKSYGNIHQHVDLIVGLPYEDMKSFKKSFNYASSLGADKLQVGFLKLLRGSKLRQEALTYGLVYSAYPTYEIIKTPWLSPREIRRLKIIEDLVEKYYNEGYFEKTLEKLVDPSNPFEFFENFGGYWEEKSYQNKKHSRESLYKIFSDYIKIKYVEDKDSLIENLRFDFLASNKGQAKSYLNPRPLEQRLYHDLLKDEEVRKAFGLTMDLPTKKLVKDFAFESFTFDAGEPSVFGFFYDDLGIKIIDITKFMKG